MNKYELAEQAGIKVYDTALPQGWVNEVQKYAGGETWVPGHFVWSYDGPGVMGRPAALTEYGHELLKKLPVNLSYLGDG